MAWIVKWYQVFPTFLMHLSYYSFFITFSHLVKGVKPTIFTLHTRYTNLDVIYAFFVALYAHKRNLENLMDCCYVINKYYWRNKQLYSHIDSVHYGSNNTTIVHVCIKHLVCNLDMPWFVLCMSLVDVWIPSLKSMISIPNMGHPPYKVIQRRFGL